MAAILELLICNQHKSLFETPKAAQQKVTKIWHRQNDASKLRPSILSSLQENRLRQQTHAKHDFKYCVSLYHLQFIKIKKRRKQKYKFEKKKNEDEYSQKSEKIFIW